MNRFIAMTALSLVLSASVCADVWRWVDANGDTHFVDTNRQIYSWRDDHGKVYFSDKPEHADASAVKLVWHSAGTLHDALPDNSANTGSGPAYPGETPDEQRAREDAEAYYCKRATELYEAYVNAPRLYATGKDGERVYLSEEEAAKTIAETKASVETACH